MSNVDRCVAQALVEKYPEHTMFVLEDLSGIRSRTERIRRKQRAALVSWSFNGLEGKISDKAKKHNCIVLKVDPACTSQHCPMCGHTERSNRNKKKHVFRCKRWRYTSNEDRIGAMNLYAQGTVYLAGLMVPGAVVVE